MLPYLFVGGLGGPELVIIFLLVILLFGANKLPKLARASGEAMGEFQKGREQIEREIRDATSIETDADGDDGIDEIDDESTDGDDDSTIDGSELESSVDGTEVDADRNAPSA